MSKMGSLSDSSRILQQVSYFSNLDPATLKSVSQEAIPRTYDPDQVVFIEGEPCPGLFIVEYGWLKVIKIGLDGREQVLNTLGPGEIFNAISVFTGALNQATVTVLEQSRLWMIPREAMLRLLDVSPSLSWKVIGDLAARIQHLISLVEDLSLRTVEARLARLLLEQAEGDLVERKRWATQAEIAARLGTVSDVLSRVLRKMVDEGKISLSRNQIRILDKQGLISIAQVE